MRRIGAAFAALLITCAIARAADIRDLPDWVRAGIHPVHLNWEVTEAPAQLPEQPAQPPPRTPGIGVHLPGFGLDPGDTGAVHIGGTGSTIEPGQVGPGPGPGLPGIVLPETVDPAAVGLIHWWRCLQEEGKLTEAGFPAWAREQGIERDRLVSALEAVPIDDDTALTYFPVCGAVWDQSGQSADECLELPPKTRLLMAGYLEACVAMEPAVALLSSIDRAGQKALSDKNLLVAVAWQLMMQRKCPRTGMWSWMRALDVGGDEAQDFYVSCVRQTCEALGDHDVARDEVAPWLEATLETPGSERYWHYAIPSLVWAYTYGGEPAKAAAAAAKWLAEADKRGVGGARALHSTRLELARALTAAGEFTAAAKALRDVMAGDERYLAETAQMMLVELAQEHPEIGDVPLPPAELTQVRPGEVNLDAQPGQALDTQLLLMGNVALNVEEARCDLPFVTATVGRRSFQRGEKLWIIEVAVDCPQQPGTYTGKLTVKTNLPDEATREVPITIIVR